MVGKQSQVATRILDLLDLNSFQSVVIGSRNAFHNPWWLRNLVAPVVGVLLQDGALHQVDCFEFERRYSILNMI